jgi:hypothetical protein
VKFGAKLTKKRIWSGGKEGKGGEKIFSIFRICKAPPQIKIVKIKLFILTLLDINLMGIFGISRWHMVVSVVGQLKDFFDFPKLIFKNCFRQFSQYFQKILELRYTLKPTTNKTYHGDQPNKQ